MTQFASSQPAPYRPVVTIASGQVQGISTDNYDYYLGIPYAEPPVDSLRFQLPIPVKPWEGIFVATQYGSPCPSIAPSPDQAQNIRDDNYWLNLNVWAPKNAHKAPVFVWIHGGGFATGSNAEELYTGETFAADGIVFVNMNYRLGTEGFGSFPDAPHNRGFADQILALRWVQENISAFGGDPQNVTLSGQSAGSRSVGTLLSSPQAQGLFHRAILESGPPTLLSEAETSTYIQELAAELGTTATAQGFQKFSPAQVNAAEAAVAQKPENAQRLFPYSAVIDGTIIPEDPMKVLRENRINMPLIIGYTACEVAFWVRIMRITPEITWDNLSTVVGKYGITSDMVEKYTQYYCGKQTPTGEITTNTRTVSAEEVFMHLLSDKIYLAPLHSIIKAQADHSYAYRFSWENPFTNFLSFHALDIPFIFKHLDTLMGKWLAGEDAPQALADHMHAGWVNFIKTGDPGWNTAGDALQYYDFDYPLKKELISTPRAELLELWDEAYP